MTLKKNKQMATSMKIFKAEYSPSRQWWHISTLNSCVLHKTFPKSKK